MATDGSSVALERSTLSLAASQAADACADAHDTYRIATPRQKRRLLHVSRLHVSRLLFSPLLSKRAPPVAANGTAPCSHCQAL